MSRRQWRPTLRMIHASLSRTGGWDAPGIVRALNWRKGCPLAASSCPLRMHHTRTLAADWFKLYTYPAPWFAAWADSVASPEMIMAAPNISCVIPAFNEEGSIEAVVRTTAATLDRFPGQHEIIVVDDASTDRTPGILACLATDIPLLHIIRNPKNLGCHPSEVIGFDAAKGDVLCFLPADGQISPDELPLLLQQWPRHGLVLTHRANRADPPGRRLVSTLYNLVLRLSLGVPARDIDSSILIDARLWRRISGAPRRESAFIHVEILLLTQQAGASFTEVTIEHYPRMEGQARGLNARDATRVPLRLATLWWKLQWRRLREHISAR